MPLLTECDSSCEKSRLMTHQSHNARSWMDANDAIIFVCFCDAYFLLFQQLRMFTKRRRIIRRIANQHFRHIRSIDTLFLSVSNIFSIACWTINFRILLNKKKSQRSHRWRQRSPKSKTGLIQMSCSAADAAAACVDKTAKTASLCAFTYLYECAVDFNGNTKVWWTSHVSRLNANVLQCLSRMLVLNIILCTVIRSLRPNMAQLAPYLAAAAANQSSIL